MKKLACLFLVFCLAASLAACGGAPAGAGSQSAAPAPAPESGSAQPAAGPIRQMVPLREDRFEYAEEFRNGYAFAIQGGQCGYVDTSGNFTAYYASSEPLLQTLLATDYMQMFVSEEGLFPYWDEASGLWGYGDIATGRMVIEPLYADATPFCHGRASVTLWESVLPEDTSGPVGTNAAGVSSRQLVIDTSGSQLFETGTILSLGYTDGYLHAFGPEESSGDYAGEYPCANLYDPDGGVIAQLPPSYEILGDSSRLMFVAGGELLPGDAEHLGVMVYKEVEDDGLGFDYDGTYYLNSAGQEVARTPEGAYYGYPWPEGESAAFYCQDGLFGLFNEAGRITDPLFTNFYYLHHGVCFVSDDGGTSWYLIDDQGRRIGQESYEAGGYLQDNDLIPACKGGKWGYLHSDGSVAVDFNFDAPAGSFSEGVACLGTAEESYVYIDTQGSELAGGLRSYINYTAEEGFYLFRDEAGYGHAYAADADGVPVSAQLQGG